MYSVDRSATSTWPAWLAGTVDKRYCWRSKIAARFAHSAFADSARSFAVDATVESADADACSERAAGRIVGSDGGSDSDAATAGGSGSSDSSAASRCSLDAAQTDCGVSAAARPAPEPTDRNIENKLS